MTDSAADRTVQARGANDARMLSFGQQRLWYLDQLAPGSAVYNVPFTSKLRGCVDVDAFKRALDKIVERHEILRTAVLPIRGTPRPVLLKKWDLDFEFVDLRNLPEPEREQRAADYVTAQARAPFDFTRGQMFRGALLRVDKDDYIFVHTAPHFAFEGSSIAVLYRELSLLYAAFVEHRDGSLPPLTVQYADFAIWQRRTLSGERLDLLNEYWKRQLSGSLPLILRYDFPRPEIQTLQGKRHFFTIAPDTLLLAQQLFELCGVSRYCGLLAVFYVLLYFYSGQTDLSVGSPFRPRCSGIEELIGFFVNTVVLRVTLTPNTSFRKLLASVNCIVRSAIAHCDLTFDKVVEVVGPERDPSRTPLFQANFRAPKQPYPALELPGICAERAQYIDNGTSKFDLALEVDSMSGQACYFEYCSGLFSEASVVQMLGDYRALLVGLIQEPDKALDQFGSGSRNS